MKKYLKTGVGLIGTTAIMGSIPNISGSATETTLKGKFAEGMGNMGKVLPVYGSVVATKMVLKPLGTLRKSSSKLMKGGMKL